MRDRHSADEPKDVSAIRHQDTKRIKATISLSLLLLLLVTMKFVPAVVLLLSAATYCGAFSPGRHSTSPRQRAFVARSLVPDASSLQDLPHHWNALQQGFSVA